MYSKDAILRPENKGNNMQKIKTKLDALGFIEVALNYALAEMPDIKHITPDNDNDSGDLDIILKNGQTIILHSSRLTLRDKNGEEFGNE